MLVVVFGILLCASMMIYTGRVIGLDGRGTLATAESFVQHGTWNINLLTGDEWFFPPPGGQGTFAPDGNLYSKKAPLLAILLVPFVAIGKLIPFIGVTQAALLFIPLVYAVTGVLIVLTAQRLGLRTRWSWIAALWWGLGTYTLANTQEIFAEPVMALGFTLAVYGTLGYTFRDSFLSGLGTALAVGGNLASIFIIAVIGIVLWRLIRQSGSRLKRSYIQPSALLQHLSVWALPVISVIAITAAFNLMRSGSIISSGYHFNSGEGFTTPLLEGLYGLIFSPYRGVVWYAPITLLVPLGAWISRKKPITMLMLLLISGQIIMFSLWWSWEGGWVWGPRFLLPVLPLMTLLSTAAAQFLWRKFPVAVIGLALISILIQIPGSLIHYSWYESDLRSRFPATDARLIADIADSAIRDPLQSPLIGTWQFLSRPDTLWPVWGFPESGINVLLLAGLTGLFLLQLLLLYSPRAWLSLILSTCSIILASIYAFSVTTPHGYDDINALFAQYSKHGDRMLVYANGMSPLLFEVSTRPSSVSMPPLANFNDPLAQRVFSLLDGANRIWWMYAPEDSEQLQSLWATEDANVIFFDVAGYRFALVDESTASEDADGY